ncbi:MFS transporter [Cellulomonas chitinilytica]|uniref:MFS transporter n=1 Tax=Cellulomonas chitinilytica TaxID=398759 RepID=A0A919U3P3_9CELL|nr:MDR family MFS transporter [Cellulomonas chitinilytica]GIG22627.1 MFS transporter [Cellulomonas chitinilytica]
MSQSTATDERATTAIDPELKRLATAVIVGGIAVILDTTIVSVGLHELGASLHATVSTIQWVSTAYLLAMFVTIPLSGWAQGRLGSKRLWLVGLSVFLLGSVLCATAWDATSLIAFRAVQGVGGGVLMPLMTTILMQAARGRNLGRLMATVSLPAALGPILGPVVGGLILHTLSWPWLFLVNLPLGVVGLVLAVRRIPRDVPGRRAPLDVVGVLLVSPGIVGVIFGLTQVGELGGFGHARVVVPLVAGLALLAAFAAWALRRGDRALIDVRLLRHRALGTSTVLLFLTGTALYGAMLLLPLYWQQVRGEDALGAGLLLVPQGVGALASRTLSGRLTDAIGGRWVAVGGFTVLALATVPFALSTEHTSTWLLMATLLVRGFGLGAVLIPLMTGAFVGLAHDEVPHASIITRVAQQVGGSFGTAVLAVVLVSSAAGATSQTALAGAFDTAFWWATAFTAAAAALSLLLPAARRAA